MAVWVIQRQLEAVGLGHLWGEVDLDGIATQIEQRRAQRADSDLGIDSGTDSGTDRAVEDRALLMAAAVVDNWRGEFERALDGFDRIVAGASAAGDHRSALRALGVGGMIWRLRGDDDQSAAQFEAALALAAAHGTAADEVYLRVLRIAGSDVPDWSTVDSELERCRCLLDDVDDPRLRIYVEQAEGWGLAAAGRSEEAIGRLEASLPLLDSPIERAVNEVRIAEVLAADGRVDPARARATTARETFESWGARYWSTRAAALMATLDGDRSARRIRALLSELPDDVAYVRLIDPAGSLTIELDGPCVARRDGEPLEFLTRHAESALRLVVAAGADGITVDELATILWPGADPSRIGQRVRTMLWQVRSTLGVDAWRLQRRRSELTFNAVGCAVVGTVDRSTIAARFTR